MHAQRNSLTGAAQHSDVTRAHDLEYVSRARTRVPGEALAVFSPLLRLTRINGKSGSGSPLLTLPFVLSVPGTPGPLTREGARERLEYHVGFRPLGKVCKMRDWCVWHWPKGLDALNDLCTLRSWASRKGQKLLAYFLSSISPIYLKF